MKAQDVGEGEIQPGIVLPLVALANSLRVFCLVNIMKPRIFRCPPLVVCFGCFWALLLAAPWGPVGLGGDKAKYKSIDQLIKDLANNRFRVREAAERELLNRAEAIPELRRAAKSGDREIARRARAILASFSRREAQRALLTLQTLGKKGEVDQVVEHFLVREDWGAASDEAWEVATNIAGKLLQLEKKTSQPIGMELADDIPFGSFYKYKAAIHPHVVATRHARIQKTGNYVIRSEDASVKVPISHSIIVASGKVRLTSPTTTSLILAGEAVEADFIGNSIVVCDGPIKAKVLSKSIVITRTWVTCDRGISDCLVVAPLGVEFLQGGGVGNSTIRKESNPLGFVTFFDPAFQFKPNVGGVRISAALDDKRFAGAERLWPNDIVTHVDGIPIQSPDHFRRILRRKLAREAKMIFKVTHWGKLVEIPVQCKQ